MNLQAATSPQVLDSNLHEPYYATSDEAEAERVAQLMREHFGEPTGLGETLDYDDYDAAGVIPPG